MLTKFSNNPYLSDTETLTKQAHQFTCAVPGDIEWGTDYLGLSISINPNWSYLDSSLWSVDKFGNHPEPDMVHEMLTMHRPFMQGTVTVTCMPLIGKAFIRFNPSACLYGKSRNLTPSGALIPLVGKLLDSLSPEVSPDFDIVDDWGQVTRYEKWPELVKITRIDCARNFFIDSPQEFKRAVAAVKPKNHKYLFEHHNGKNGWGLTSRTKRVGEDKVYDKDAQMGILSEGGAWFRFEAQLREDRVTSFGFKSLADVTDSRVWSAIEGRWAASRWGVKLTTKGSFLEAIKNLPFKQQCNLVEYLQIHVLGLASQYSPSRHRTVGKLARTMGFIPGEPLDAQGKATRIVNLWVGAITDIEEK